MPDEKGRPDVATTVERHGRDLQRVNDKLRDLISTLQTHKERHTSPRAPLEGVPTLTPPPIPSATPAPDGGALALDRRRLEAELALAREQLARASAERNLLRDRLAELEAEHRRACDEFVEAEEQTGELVQLFATLQQIHGAGSREDVLQALQEVVVNVIGSEELAILERQGGELRLARAFGVDPAPLRRVAVGEGVLGRVAESGDLFLAGAAPAEEDDRLSACVPLTAGGQVVGVVAIYRLLGHKPGLGPSDRAVLDLLTPHAGLALSLRRAAEPAA